MGDEIHRFFHRSLLITVDLVIFACLYFRETLTLGFFTKFKIRESSFSFNSAIIIIIFAGFLNSRICPPREIRENQNLANITRSTVLVGNKLDIMPYHIMRQFFCLGRVNDISSSSMYHSFEWVTHKTFCLLGVDRAHRHLSIKELYLSLVKMTNTTI